MANIKMEGSITNSAAARRDFNIIEPLDDFYEEQGVPLPPFEEVSGEDVPEPYKTLLVHKNDMTPTLETFHGRDIHLRVLSRRLKGDEYFREVVVLLDETDEPVEFGAIKINLDRFSPKARAQVLDEVRPLGHILAEIVEAHASHPKCFLKFTPDGLIKDALAVEGDGPLYGRRNTLWDPEGLPMAEIVEILPAVKTAD
jgi:chorismate-pyruvate lyase